MTTPKTIFDLIVRCLIGGILFYAGLTKALATAEFAAAIEAYKLLPPNLITPLAMGLPWVEMAVGTFLFFGYWIRPFAATAAALFTVFLTVLISAQFRGIDLASCGCFGADTLSPHVTLAMDSVLLILSLILARTCRQPALLALDNWIDKP